MIKFDKRIVQFGFGAVGKSFYEKVSKEIDFDEKKYYVISRDNFEFEAFINLGGMTENFIVCDINKDNFAEEFGKILTEGDLLIDFADTVGTKDILKWCAENNIMYINTGEADWPENWYSIFNENEIKCKMREEYSKDININKYPIILQHGNNPGLVSHFVKAGIEYIAKKQLRKDKLLKELIKENKFNEAARHIGLRMIHVNDSDLQQVVDEKEDILYSTWCIDSFWFEMLSEATFNVGTHEKVSYKDECKSYDEEKGYFEFRNLAADKKCSTYYPKGKFEAFLVPHEETITIAKSLEVKENGQTVYRPSVMFLYSPCDAAVKYFEKAKVNDYPDVDPEKPQDVENLNGISIVRGHIYPPKTEVIYKEKIESGTEYVGVLLLGEKFDPVWVGNRIEKSFLYKSKKDSYWQTPTITPVAMSALSAVIWMIKNKNKGGIYFPDDIIEYQDIIKKSEKYISKTIYKTFKKEEVSKAININFDDIQFNDIVIKKEE